MLHNFRFNIIFRTVIMVVLVIGFVLSINQGYYLTTFFLGAILSISVFNLIQYVNQTNRDLANFLSSIKYNDFTTTGSAKHKGKSFGELHDSFNLINRKFRDIRAEKEANHQFLQTIVKHIDIGLLCIDSSDEVIMMNKALQELLHKSYLLKLDGLKKVDQKLYTTIKELKPGERQLIKLNIKNKLLQLAIQSIDLKLHKEPFKLVTFQNIKTELEEQELVAWQKLIRILTHEIMNSVAPIASISSTIKDVLGKNGQMDMDTQHQIQNFIGVIQRRSEGLLDFTETYRSLTRIPPPKYQIIEGASLIKEIITFFQPELETQKVNYKFQPPATSISFQGDPGLLEQVLINIIKNAMDAVKGKENPLIEILLKKNVNNKVIIQVADNGKGIPEEVLDQVFVPFFTTKKEGSGIGLSLSRQIMRLHKGNIELHSIEGEGTVVRLII